MARLNALDINVAFAAEDGFFESEVQPLGDVLSGAGLAGRARSAAKEGIENIAETAERVEAIERPVTAAVNAGVPEPIVSRAFLLVAEDLVRLVYFLEFILGAGRLVPVRVELHGLPAEGATDLFVVRRPVNSEGLVIIDWHIST